MKKNGLTRLVSLGLSLTPAAPLLPVTASAADNADAQGWDPLPIREGAKGHMYRRIGAADVRRTELQ